MVGLTSDVIGPRYYLTLGAIAPIVPSSTQTTTEGDAMTDEQFMQYMKALEAAQSAQERADRAMERAEKLQAKANELWAILRQGKCRH
jgi:hypothetical protein